MKDHFVDGWVKFRTSMWYVYLFCLFCSTWMVLAYITGFDHDWSRLNLIISITTELQSIILLIYVARITERDKLVDRQDKEETKELMHKIDNMLVQLQLAREEIKDISEEED